MSRAATKAGVGALDRELEQLRHGTSGLYSSRLRTALLDGASWRGSPVHYRLLRTVEATEPMRPSVSELADTLLTDKARASRLVDEAQLAGWVRRQAGRLDRRRREVELTEQGRAALAAVRELRLATLAEVLDDWHEADVAQLASLLGRLNRAVRAR